MNKILIYLFLFLFNSIINIYETTSISNFNQITYIDDKNLELININFNNVKYDDLFYYYCLVSEELENYENYYIWFKNIENIIHNSLIKEFKSIKLQSWDINKKQKFCEKLLYIIHQNIFKKYNPLATRVSSIINNGNYNCVSSSILYTIFLKKYFIDCVAVETEDHVFIKVIIDSEQIDVETTNIHGFNPGNKRNVIDDFGKITGFSYIPQQDYNKRNDISIKKLLFLVYHNLYAYYFDLGRYEKATNLGYIIFLGRDDKIGKKNFKTFINNYTIILKEKNEYFNAINFVNSYLEKIYFDEDIIKLRFNLLNDYINKWEELEKYSTINLFLLDQNNKFKKLKDHQEFISIYLYFIHKTVSYLINNNNFNKSYEIIKQFNLNYDMKEMNNIFENTLIHEIKLIEEKNNFDLIKNIIFEKKIEFPEYINMLNKYEKKYLIYEVDYLIASKNYKKALSKLKKLLIIYSNDNDVISRTLNCYFNYTYFLLEKDEYEKAIFSLEEALLFFPNEKSLLKNYYNYLIRIITILIDKEDFAKARKYYEKAIDKFPNESYLIILDNTLRKNYY